MRAFTAEPGYTDDFFLVREFLVRINADRVRTPGFLWARWEWAFTLPFLDTSALDRIGIWQRDGLVVGLVTFEEGPGDAWLVVDPGHRDLLPAMVDHAVRSLAVDGRVRVMVPDDDPGLAEIVASRGLVRTAGGEPNAVLELDADLEYSLPDGLGVQSLAEDWDLRAFHRLLHRGFDHPGEPDWAPSELAWRQASTSSPGQRPDLQVITRTVDGAYTAFCGAWLRPGADYALIEPVCTDPAWRRRGCGRAAVLEAARRCRDLGARHAYVGSGQEFYRRLGFTPALGGTWWSTETTLADE
ncbi:GNAT family N-acetyltransferase [Actinotalea sp. M2MS4P-6]|uniref:GNAT family N-acetyltransferase n=1 Tax=Actinotalea sp. M2MS4P-6 TaxID=2983762 RepID=UPI0021E3D9C9|nr:GNAT family N-acetyltransferase [Actinotalea sp. M2MS4P-6]MCV2392815.1 GNAT family N-acetyltransferase [Actinotalea sp. M2MS4P-6]